MDELTRLLLRARDGDDDALAAFVGQTQPEIWRLCAHLAGRSDADDATQETYLGAWRALPGYRADASARTWLFVIARRSAERVAMRRRRWSELAERAPGPAAAAAPEHQGELDELLAGLEADRRSALVLTQVLGLSYAEAAEICECPIGTIRSRVARAREDLIAMTRDDSGTASRDR